MNDIEKLIKNLEDILPRFENKIVGVGEVNVANMIKDCIRALNSCEKQNEKIKQSKEAAEKEMRDIDNAKYKSESKDNHKYFVKGKLDILNKILEVDDE